MDATLLARIQFGLTVGFHFIFPPLSIGMAWLIFLMMFRYIRTKKPICLTMARFWTKIFALTFAVGVATGIVMEFEFGTNWADYSRFVGDIFGAPLAAEGIFAFFLESTFLGVLLFGWKKFSEKTLMFSSLMVAFGSTLSAFWIIVANSWQQTPAGYQMVDGRPQMTSFFEAVFNPSTLIRYVHTVDASIMAGAFMILALSAWFLLRKKHVEFALESAKMALVVGLISTSLQLFFGHHHAVQVYNTQPVKLAAFEGLFETSSNASLLVFGLPDATAEKTHLAVRLPGMLSYGVSGDINTVVKGLKDFPKDLWPPIAGTFYSFHLMVGLWALMMLVMIWGIVLLWRNKLAETPLYLKLALWSLPAPILACELGWIAAEVGRQPWIVQGLLKTSDAASKVVGAGEILLSIIIFTAIYALLFGVWVFAIKRKLEHGPEPVVLEDKGVKA